MLLLSLKLTPCIVEGNDCFNGNQEISVKIAEVQINNKQGGEKCQVLIKQVPED